MLSKGIRVLALLLMTSACTIGQQGTKQNIEFHPPLVYSDWETLHFTDRDGRPSCTISSGYKGIEVTIHGKQGDMLEVAVRSGQILTPGQLFTINVGRNHYQTAGVFQGSDAVKILEDLSKNDKAYIEWSEMDGFRNTRRRWSNILKLDGFRTELDKCV